MNRSGCFKQIMQNLAQNMHYSYSLVEYKFRTKKVIKIFFLGNYFDKHICTFNTLRISVTVHINWIFLCLFEICVCLCGFRNLTRIFNFIAFCLFAQFLLLFTWNIVIHYLLKISEFHIVISSDLFSFDICQVFHVLHKHRKPLKCPKRYYTLIAHFECAHVYDPIYIDLCHFFANINRFYQPKSIFTREK